MMKTTRFILGMTVLLLSLDNQRGQAQNTTKLLRLQEAISNTLANNQQIRLSGLDEKIAESRYQQTEAIFLPQLQLSYTVFNSNNPLNAFGFKLQQKIVSATDFNPAVLNHPTNTSDFSAKAALQQPIINMDLWFQRKAAAKQTEVYAHQTQRTKEFLTFEVQKAYTQLALAHRAVVVLQEAQQTSKAVEESASRYFKQGLIQKSDLLNAQVYTTSIEKDLAEATSNIQTVSDYLSNLMGLGLGITYLVDAADGNGKSDTLMQNNIYDNRSDFQAIQKAIEASDLMIAAQQKSYLPKLNAFANYQLNDNRLLGFGAGSYLVGMQMNWNIFNGNSTKNAIHTQTIERAKLAETLQKQKNEALLELHKTERQLQDGKFAVKQFEIATARAAESLRILQNRYQQGLVNTTDVLMAATQLSQQKFALLQAQANISITKAYLQFLTSK